MPAGEALAEASAGQAQVPAEVSAPSAVGEEVSWSAMWADKSVQMHSCEAYVQKLAENVSARLTKHLQGPPAVGGIDMKGALHEQEPLQI